MNAEKIGDWLHVASNFAVLVGLAVVAYEIRQNSVLARGELAESYLSNWEEIHRSKQDASFATTLAKSVDAPNELTREEILQLDGYFSSVMLQLNIDRYLSEFGIFREPHEIEARKIARIHLTNRFAQVWWQSSRFRYDPVTVAIIDDEIAAVSDEESRKFLDDIESALSE